MYCFLGAVFLELILSASASWRISVWGSYLILLGALVVFLFGYKKRITLFLFFCLLGIFLGWWRTGWELSRIYERAPQQLSGYGYIFDIPEIKEDYQKLIVCLVEASGKDQKNSRVLIQPNCREKIVVLKDLHSDYSFGQIVRVECQLKNPENKQAKFDYIKFLAKDHIYQICQSAKVEKIDEDKYQLAGFYKFKTSAYRSIFKIKNSLEQKINLSFSFPESAYLAGLLLGGEDRLPKDIQENFRRTGTTHTIAVSGFNITILAGFFMWLGILIGFYRQKAFWLAVVGITFFVLMIGSPSSAVRAGIMGILLLWAAKKGRLADSVQLIILAGALMIGFSPLILFYDVGFQLSFLASLSIVLIYGPLSEKFNIKSDFLELKSILLVTMSAQLGVLGVLLYTFETFSPISLLANLLILPLVPLMMLTGFITVLTAFFSPLLASFMALPTQLALNLEIVVIEKLAQISWASLEIGNIGIWGLIFYYLALFVFVRFLRKKAKMN
ncbi:MAG: ComEC/Rec2 family competence protein [Candidatus Moranbacteria bacterium]|nr:ComEC/Rec2 family competence protein [Candidatus Moranbacteria bacterium]